MTKNVLDSKKKESKIKDKKKREKQKEEIITMKKLINRSRVTLSMIVLMLLESLDSLRQTIKNADYNSAIIKEVMCLNIKKLLESKETRRLAI